MLPSPLPQPAGERLQRHRRGHGHQHPAPQPPLQRSSTPACACAGQSRRHAGRSMGCISGPGLPHQRHHHGQSGIRQAYATGRGKIRRPRPHGDWRNTAGQAHPHHRHGARIRSTSACSSPPSPTLWRKAAEGISDIRDESDRNGMRMVIEPAGREPQVVLNHLFAPDPAPGQFFHQHAGAGGQPVPAEDPLPAPHPGRVPPKYQEEIIVRRTKYDLRKARSAPICWRACSSPRTTSTRSCTSSATATTTPSRT